MAVWWNEVKEVLVEDNPIRYYFFVAKWLWKNRRWANTRQKWKALEKAWAVHERERREGSA